MQQTNPNYLQRQYTKLTQKLQKAYQSGKFYQYTQYKQSQLLDKLASYTLQLKKLGMAAAVVTGVGMATPAAGQILFMDNTSTTNPLNVDDTLSRCAISFADLDADGDLDIVGSYYASYYDFKNVYYENVGAADSAVYARRNPLFVNSDDLSNIAFVDIDGDGDLDAFASTDVSLYSTGEAMTYFENTGTSISPAFVKRANNMNALDTINLMYPRATYGNKITKGSTFIDLDADGDQDLFYFVSTGATPTQNKTFLYFKNNGDSLVANFDLESNNPFKDTLINYRPQYNAMQFIDADNDNDLDVVVGEYFFYENKGSAANPLYDTKLAHNDPANPFYNLRNSGLIQHIQLVDIDGDGDLDLFGSNGAIEIQIYENQVDTMRYYENLTITALPKIEQQQKINLTISPNPTTGYLQLDRPITGAMEIFNTAGQVVQSAQLNEEQAIDLGDLTNGIYFLKVQTAKGLINEKVVLSK